MFLILIKTLWKKGCFVTSFATQFLSCIGHLQFTVFICCECYWTSCKSCNLSYIWCNLLQLNYKFVATTLFQLLCNFLMIIIIMLCWRHFLSIHQNLTHGTMRIFCDCFEILIYPLSIMIIHLKWSRIMTPSTIKRRVDELKSSHISFLICYVSYFLG